MNQVSTEQLDALLQQFGPRRREAFCALKLHNDLIEGLRRRGASFYTIHQVLRAQGVQTCPTMIRDYCRKVLAEPRQRMTRKGKNSKSTSDCSEGRPARRRCACSSFHSDSRAFDRSARRESRIH